MSRTDENRDLTLFVALNENGAMPMMKDWFYPGDRDGYAFVDPSDQARIWRGSNPSKFQSPRAAS